MRKTSEYLNNISDWSESIFTASDFFTQDEFAEVIQTLQCLSRFGAIPFFAENGILIKCFSIKPYSNSTMKTSQRYWTKQCHYRRSWFQLFCSTPNIHKKAPKVIESLFVIFYEWSENFRTASSVASAITIAKIWINSKYFFRNKLCVHSNTKNIFF